MMAFALLLQWATDLPTFLWWAVGLAILIVSFRIYGRLLGRLLHGKGKVDPEGLGLPDLLVVIVLGSWLGGMAARGFLSVAGPREMTSGDVVESAILFGLFVGAITFFLQYRRIPVARLFGFRRVGAGRVLKYGLGFLLAAYPLVFLLSAVMQQAMGEQAETQEIVQYFIDAVQNAERWRVVITAFVAIFVAPFAEEFLFRGYIYGTLKRHTGPLIALVLSAALFAAIHVNVLALPALFVLALCLALAYEATGSLFVPMVMHSVFNAVTLGLTLTKVISDLSASQ